MIQPIYLYGSEVLRRTAQPVDVSDKEAVASLIQDLKDRTGLDIRDVEIGQIDFLKDSAFIKITYHPEIGETFSIQNTRKLNAEN